MENHLIQFIANSDKDFYQCRIMELQKDSKRLTQVDVETNPHTTTKNESKWSIHLCPIEQIASHFWLKRGIPF